MVYRDADNKTLEDYPRPSVAVDTAVLTVSDALGLSVLLVQASAEASGESRHDRLPGTFLHPDELLADAVRRSLREKAEVTGLRPRQLHVFDDPARDPRGWVLSVAHFDVVPSAFVDAASSAIRLVPVSALPPLAYGHEEIVRMAVERMRADYRTAPDPGNLLPERFTLRELHLLHQTVAGDAIQRDTFRRAMSPQLVATGERTNGAMGKPAELFTRRD